MIIHNTCPLCSSKVISSYLKCTDYLKSGEEFNLFRCSECGFIFTNGYPESDKIGRYYESEDYISHDDAAKGFLNRIYAFARKIMLKRKRRMVEKAAGLKKGRILDIGSGTGYFAGTMKKAGWNVTGIEPNIKARDFGSIKFGYDSLSPEKISELPPGSFDCITMWHVLEHLHYPFNQTLEIKRLLKPGGIWITASPNSGSFDARHYKDKWAAYDVPRHLWHYSADTLNVFANKSGFTVSGIRSLPLDVFYISILSENQKGNRLSLLTGLFYGLLFAIGVLFDKRKSSSLIYFLRIK